MREYVALHEKILQREHVVMQNYITTNRADFKRNLDMITGYINKLPISEEQKGTLHIVMEYHRLLAESCLRHLETAHSQGAETMRKLFPRLSFEEQRAVVRSYGNSELFVLQGDRP